MLLAVDSDLMHPVEPVEQYRHGVVYLGQMSTTKEGLVPMLHAVTDLGFAIYGLGGSLQAGSIAGPCMLYVPSDAEQP